MKRITSCLIVLGLLSVPFAFGADQQEDEEVTPVPPHILFHPGGLEAAAKIHGHYFAHGDLELPWVESNLTFAQLSEKADIIVVATVSSIRSYTTGQGEFIDSEFSLAVTRTLKGSAPPELRMVAEGGKVTFQKGTWAEIRTAVSGHFKPNAEFLLFLKRVKPENLDPSADQLTPYYRLVGRNEGAIQLNWESQTVTPLASVDGLPHGYAADLERLSPPDLIQRAVAQSSVHK